jgi:hypothetical protein
VPDSFQKLACDCVSLDPTKRSSALEAFLRVNRSTDEKKAPPYYEIVQNKRNARRDPRAPKRQQTWKSSVWALLLANKSKELKNLVSKESKSFRNCFRARYRKRYVSPQDRRELLNSLHTSSYYGYKKGLDDILSSLSLLSEVFLFYLNLISEFFKDELKVYLFKLDF